MNIRTKAKHRLLPIFGSGALGLLVGCYGGGNKSSEPPPILKVEPATATLAQGQSLQFTATNSWGFAPIWSLSPADGGTISASGLFTASGTTGEVTVMATCKSLGVWMKGHASAQVIILPPPSPAVTNPDLVQAGGQQQRSTNGSLQGASVIGAPTPGGTASGPEGSAQVLHGFTLPIVKPTK